VKGNVRVQTSVPARVQVDMEYREPAAMVRVSGGAKSGLFPIQDPRLNLTHYLSFDGSCILLDYNVVLIPIKLHLLTPSAEGALMHVQFPG